MTKYERLEERAFKAFHKRAGNNGEQRAAHKANIIYWKAKDKGWFDKPEDLAIFMRMSRCLDDLSNGDKPPENVYWLFAAVREM